jgi:hypothetical protein
MSVDNQNSSDEESKKGLASLRQPNLSCLEESMLLDCHGKKISIGSKVKLLRLDSKVIEFLPEDEVEDINSMINDIVEVYDVRGSFVCIEKSWQKNANRSITHRLSTLPEDVELI